MSLYELLFQFLSRLSFGLSAAMAGTPAKHVTSGFYRNHLYVLLGLNVLAGLAAMNAPPHYGQYSPIVCAVASYIGSVLWLYEQRAWGRAMLCVVAGFSASGALFGWGALRSGMPLDVWRMIDVTTSSMVLGTTICAMFLGHWYLNTPTMKLEPLRYLLVHIGVSLGLRIVACAIGLTLNIRDGMTLDATHAALLTLRWLAGFVGPLAAAWMAWQTLKIPNTQSATGILYVAVIGTFLGELASLLLSARAAYPV